MVTVAKKVLKVFFKQSTLGVRRFGANAHTWLICVLRQTDSFANGARLTDRLSSLRSEDWEGGLCGENVAGAEDLMS